VSDAQPDASATRFTEVDLLKGVGILSVILIHSMRAPWHSGISSVEEWLGHATRFAVPGFFAASGYLYATTRAVPEAVTVRRLVRVLVPYLLASALAQAFYIATDRAPETGPVWWDFLVASSFGPYYFVLIITVFIAASPFLALLDRRRVGWLLIPLLLAQLLLETGIIPAQHIFWHLRNPFLWAGYFVLGWWLRLHRDAVTEALAIRRARWVSLAVLVWIVPISVLALPGTLPRIAVGSLAWIAILAALALAFAATAGAHDSPLSSRALRWLSDASYPIYLYHLFFIKIAAQHVDLTRRVFEPERLFAIWASGVVGSLAVVWLGRKLLGRYSRTWLGA
jgi:peptidoglycan/LPS O-acetylase OafA/YrhL